LHPAADRSSLRTAAHPESFQRLDEAGTTIPPYRPTYDFPGPYLDSVHESLGTGPLRDGFLVDRRTGGVLGWPIRGWLRREDALKLYEIAYFAAGDILELGSFHGLSTSLLALARRAGPGFGRIDSVDLARNSVAMTRLNLLRQGLLHRVRVHRGDALAFVRARRAEGRRYAMAFVDHSHAYGPVYEVCRELSAVVSPGGFCLFHDFNDPRNYDPEDADHGVHQAVTGGLDPAAFEFYGLYGVVALYRRS
jgi:SAM-dependent methyltransferase